MTGNLIDKLPAVRGRYTQNAELSNITWFRVGGAAEVLYKPAGIEDLAHFLKEKPQNIPIHVIGVGSNLLVRDGGVPGVVIRLGKGFNNIFVDGDTIEVGAGVLDRNVASVACEESIEGLEFFCGIPGTIGGALRMNAGCYGSEVKDVLESALAMDEEGNLHRLSAEECGFSYRHSGVPEGWIFISARFKGRKGNQDEIQAKVKQFLEQREQTQPVKTRTGGSTFANPDGQKAWELIDKAGCRGMKIGGAQVSELHCNFLMNIGDATATQLEELGETIRERVKDSSGVDLRWEIQRLGEKLSQNNKEKNVA